MGAGSLQHHRQMATKTVPIQAIRRKGVKRYGTQRCLPRHPLFFEGDFLPHRKAFQMRCPPAMRLDKGMQLCASGESKNWMYYLCKGKLRVYTGNSQGNERTVALLGPDSIAGLDCFLPEAPSLMTIACMTDCWLIPFQNSFLEELTRNDPKFAVTLTQYYCKVLRQLCYDAANQSIHSVFLRLANFLLVNWDETGEAQVRLSQQELAYAVNCSRASISRACRVLKKRASFPWKALDSALCI